MNLSAQAEPLAGCIDEYAALLEMTHDGICIGPDGMPFVPTLKFNRSLYLWAEAAGVLSFVSLRDDGTLVGAAATLVQPHIHYAETMTAVTDRLHLTPAAQAHGGADILFDGVKRDLKRLGVQRWFMGERLERPCPISLHEHGFTPVETQHAMWIGA